MRSISLDEYRDRAPLRVGCLSQCFSAECTTEGVLDVVLVKQLLPALARDPEIAARWLSLAEENTRLQHPGCVQVLDFGLDHGEAYVVLDQVRGSSLRELLLAAQQSELWPSVEAVVALAQGALEALAHAHELGLAHLDLDPHALILQRDGSVVLTEFGMWQALPAANATRERFDKGRVAYLAPELAKSQPGDLRSDVFSLGVILYELLAKKRPFQGPTQLVTAMLIAEGKRQPLAEAAPDVPELLCDVVEVMLAVSPDERFQSAKAALGALVSSAQGDRAALRAWLERLDMRSGPRGISRPTPQAQDRVVSASAQPAPRETTALPVTRPSTPLAPSAAPALRAEPATPAPPPLLASQPPSLGGARDGASDDWLAPPPLLSPSSGVAQLPAALPAATEGQVRDGKTAFLERGALLGSTARPAESAPAAFAPLPSAPPAVARPVGAPSAPPPASLPPSFAPPVPVGFAPVREPFGAPAERAPEPPRPTPALSALPALPDMPPDASGRDAGWREPSKTVFQMKRFAKSATQRGDARAPTSVIVLLAVAFGFALVAGVVLLWRLSS